MRVERTIIVERPVEKVFAFLTDMHKVKLWLPVENIRQTSSGPMRVGSTFVQDAQFLGQRFRATSVVTHYEPPHVFGLKIQGPFSLMLINSMHCEPTSTGGTKLRMVGEADPGPAIMLMGPFIVPLITKQLDTQISKLTRALETQA